METEKLFELLSSFFSGNATEADQQLINTWRQEKEENQLLFEELERIWKNSGSLDSFFLPDIQAGWEKVKHQIKTDHSEKVVPIRKTNYWRVAAAIALLACVGIIARSYFVTSDQVIYSTKAGETKDFMLPDSSHIWLNSNSTFTYSKKDFNRKERNVALDGEAYFEVKRNEQKPFIIEANETYTQVLGTTFNVRSYKSEKAVEVSVNSGKVQLSMGAEKVILVKGERGIANQTNHTLEKGSSDENFISWKTKVLEFNNASLSALIPQVEKYFMVEIQADSTLLDCHFTGTFTNPKLPEVLETIAMSTGLQYTYVGNKVSISGQSCR